MAADMPSPRAANVCAICKARKKRCDKTLPRCGYCTRKALTCEYSQPALPSPLTPTTTLAPHAATPRSYSNAQLNPLMCSSLLLLDTISPTPLAEQLLGNSTADLTPDLDELVYSQTHRIIRATGRFLDDISVCFFRSVHHFVPVISRRGFQQNLFAVGRCPRADFSILLLAICLLTHHPDPSRRGCPSQGTVYLTVKSLFTQVQAVTGASLHLVQAGLLLAVYEYAYGNPDAALVSVLGCARMGHLAGLDRASALPKQVLTDVECQQVEGANTWWGIVICERTFRCEGTDLSHPRESKFPGQDACLPIETTTMDQPEIHDLVTTPLIPLTTCDVGGFGRAAQASWLLDRVLCELECPDLHAKMTKLGELDRELQSFLAIVIQQCQGTWGIFCGAIAIAIRSHLNPRGERGGTSGLFVLHWHILGLEEQMAAANWNNVDDLVNSSYAALDTASKMVIDIADSHQNISVGLIDTLPPSCAYIIRATLRHLRGNSPRGLDPWIQGAEGRLQTSLAQFNCRWDTGWKLDNREWTNPS